MEKRTNIESTPQESRAVWEQLLRLAEEGDIRAIKLYYEMLEKKQRSLSSGGGSPDMEQMADIRRAVFGDAAAVTASGPAVGYPLGTDASAAVTAASGDVPPGVGGDVPDAGEDW